MKQLLYVAGILAAILAIVFAFETPRGSSPMGTVGIAIASLALLKASELSPK